MKPSYIYRKTGLKVLCCCIFISGTLFSQQKDPNATDTVISAMVDSTTAVQQGNDTSSINRYNFYIDYALWARPDSVQLRKVPDSAVSQLRSDEAFWYANKEFKKKNLPPSQKTFWNWLSLQKWYRAVIWIIIIGGFIAVLIAYLTNSDTGIFRRRSKRIASPADDKNGDNIFSINYAAEIEKAINADNYRMGVRLLFLRLLKTLSEKQLIQYKEGSTNQDYLWQLRDKSLYKDFFRLARNYEYTWYGGFELNRDLFIRIRGEFENLNTTINNHSIH